MNDERQKEDGQTAGDAERERTAEIPTHEQELARLKEDRDQLEAKLQRAMADLQNIRRRQRQEVDDSRQRTLEALTQELLPVLDTFSMALQAYDSQAESADPKALVDGVRMVRTMLSGALERHGLQEIAEAGPFDPNHHEAMSVEPSDEIPAGHILRTLLTGYLLGDRVVRHSRVVVAGPPAGGRDGASPPDSDGTKNEPQRNDEDTDED